MIARRVKASRTCLFLCVVLVGCPKRQSEETEIKNEVGISELGRDVGLKLPSSGRVLGLRRERGIDDAVLAKIELPASEWKKIASQPPLDSAELKSENKAYLPDDDGWWDPNRAPSLRAAQIQMPEARVLNIGVVEPTKAGTVVLYIMNHGT